MPCSPNTPSWDPVAPDSALFRILAVMTHDLQCTFGTLSASLWLSESFRPSKLKPVAYHLLALSRERAHIPKIFLRI